VTTKAAAAVGFADRETDFVQSLQRGLAVIRAFDADNPTLTLSDVARATGLARAAARRFLLTLVDLGYIRVEGRQFQLSPRVLELGRPYLSSLTLPEIALPHLRAATAELQESSSLAVLDGTDIVYVAHAPAKRILSISIDIGTRDLAFATSLGRVLLAGLARRALVVDPPAHPHQARGDHAEPDNADRTVADTAMPLEILHRAARGHDDVHVRGVGRDNQRNGGAAAGPRQRRARERGAKQRMSQVVQVP